MNLDPTGTILKKVDKADVVKGVFTIPESVKTIDARAFARCDTLTTLNIPNSITKINDGAFIGCSQLKKLVLPKTITTIPGWLIEDCTQLKELMIPKSVTTINSFAFRHCSLENITIPPGVKSIGQRAFMGSEKLKRVIISEGVKTLEEGLFFGCKSLDMVVLPKSITSINPSAFEGCHALRVIAVDCTDESLEIIKARFPAAVRNKIIDKKIIDEALRVLASEIKKIDDALPTKKSMRTDTLMKSITKMQNQMHRRELPIVQDELGEYRDHLKSDVENALSNIKFAAEEFKKRKETLSRGLDQNKTILARVDERSIVNGTFKIPKTVTTIAEHAFHKHKNLTELVIPETVTTIHDSAFFKCTNLKRLVIPNSVTKIGSRAFEGCFKLEKLILSNGITTIPGWLVEGCTQLKELDIPKSVHTIHEFAFRNSGLKKINLPEEGLKSIGQSAFLGSDQLEAIILPKGITQLGNSLFLGCKRLKSVTILEGPTYLPGEAFSQCSALKTVHLPKSMVHIGKQAFLGCSALQSITLPENTQTIQAYAFHGCSALESIILPKNIQSIDKEAFGQCFALNAIVIDADPSESLDSIKEKLPNHLKEKVIHKKYWEEANQLLNQQRLRIQGALPKKAMYEEALPNTFKEYQVAMKAEPFPKNPSEMQAYQKKLKKLADQSIAYVQQLLYLGERTKNQFEKQLASIEKKAGLLSADGYTEDGRTAQELCDTIRKEYKKITPESAPKFKEHCLSKIREARHALESHRGWKLALSYLALSVTILAIPLVIADVVHTYKTGSHYSLFKTKTAKKLDKMANLVEEMPDEMPDEVGVTKKRN